MVFLISGIIFEYHGHRGQSFESSACELQVSVALVWAVYPGIRYFDPVGDLANRAEPYLATLESGGVASKITYRSGGPERYQPFRLLFLEC